MHDTMPIEDENVWSSDSGVQDETGKENYEDAD
jgi:hypothetical protein